MAMSSPSLRHLPHGDDLLLRETNHRCANDLQLVVSLLGLQSRRAEIPEVRQALADAMDRVAILARARGAINHGSLSLEAALLQTCEALQAQAEPRSILISLHIRQNTVSLSANQITILALVVNELTTNAIKHAFSKGASGHVTITVNRITGGDLVITIDDDGLPLPKHGSVQGSGLGLGLAKRLMASIDGLLIPPSPGSKLFQLEITPAAEC